MEFLKRFKLIHRVNIVFYISMIMILVLIGVFYFTSNMMAKNLQKNYQLQMKIHHYSNAITDNLKLLDYLTIENSLTIKHDYAKKSKEAYDKIFKNLKLLQESNFFDDEIEAQKTMKRIHNRLIGYKTITNSFKEEVEGDYEDGLFAVLALSTTSHIISDELKKLNNYIQIIAKRNIAEVQKEMFHIRVAVVSIVLSLFLLMLFINREIVRSIIQPLAQIKEEISSFFELLLKKRDSVVHIKYSANDEISEIADVIDSNIYIAEEILQKEREESKRIERLVELKTKEISELNNELEATQREVIFTMGAVAEERSRETGHHVKRVAEYSLVLARLYGLSLEESLLLKNASPMHDIGKIAIPDAILHKPGKFTDEEFKLMQDHAEIGYKMLCHSSKSILKAAAIVAHEHHEKWDGTGYPRGLKGEEIHIYGRITAVADVFDALGSDRVYKKAWPLDKILKLFQEERGKQFDPHLVDLFMDNLEHFLAVKENIESEENMILSKYIENFEKVDNFIAEQETKS
jgi:HD-GYP domain-containing protein (c-di-GMP phosphodiesterase class II)